MERHAVPRVVLGAALFALAACSPATGGSASVTPTIEPLQTTTPEATQASLLPDGSWQVDLTPEELIAAGSPVEDAHGGKYTYTFAGTRARINVEWTDQGEIECTADAEPSTRGVALKYEAGPCGGGVDTIHWMLDADGLHLVLDATNSGALAANKAWTEAKVWQPIAGQAPLGTVPPWQARCEPGCQGPIAAGTFESSGFMPGLQMTFADDSWFNTADYPDEIEFDRSDSALRFWQMPGASSDTGELLADVPRTVDGLTDWFVGNPDMDVSDPEEITIDDGIAAKTFTFDVSDANVNDDPGCPVKSCLNVLWINDGHVFGIADGSGERLYLFDVGTGPDARTIVASVDTPPQKLDKMSSDVDAILSTLHAP